MKKCSSGKRVFFDRVSAEARIRVNQRPLFVYQCPECKFYHYTSKRPLQKANA